MKIIKVNNKNKNIFQKVYINALEEGFLDFVPRNMIKNLNKNFESCFDEINMNNWEPFICFEGDIPIGVLVFGKAVFKGAKTTDGFLDSIYFLKSFCGKGYAQNALEYIEDCLKRDGFKRLFLWCSIENKRAWRFYEKNGFEQTTQTWNDDLDGQIFHNILLYKNISH